MTITEFLQHNFGSGGLFLLSRPILDSKFTRDTTSDSPMIAWLRDQAEKVFIEHEENTEFLVFIFKADPLSIIPKLEDQFPEETAGCWFDCGTFLDYEIAPEDVAQSEIANGKIHELLREARIKAAELSQAPPGTFLIQTKKSNERTGMTHEDLLRHLERFAVSDVSDIHLRPDRTPFIRSAGGDVMDISRPAKPMSESEIFRHVSFMSQGKETYRTIEAVMNPGEGESYSAPGHFPPEGCNFSADILNAAGSTVGRFRYNVFLSHPEKKGIRGLSVAIRRIPLTPKTPAELGFPPPADLLVRQIKQGFVRNGLILIAGPTGTGKSTTLNAILHEINLSRSLHIMTLEDPVEFRYIDRKARFTQIEVGTDVEGFQSGLKNLLRQDPDIIVIGEIRDPAVAMLALAAAKTGHLVLATIHSSTTAVGALKKIMEFAREQGDLSICSHTIQAVIAQKLVPPKPNATRADRLLAMEIFFPMADENINQLILDDAPPEQFRRLLYDGKLPHLTYQTLEQSLNHLVSLKLIDDSDAAAFANDPGEYKRISRGRESTSDPHKRG